jgi:ribosomal protein S18 acetylase RimI-like enzyme
VQTGEIGYTDLDSFPDAKETNTLTEEWFTYFCRINNVSDINQSTLWQILETIALPRCFVTVRDVRNPIACEMSVLQEQYCGLFDIVTDASLRRKVFGKQTVQRQLAWGEENGAREAYLQVMLNNAPAVHLYHLL